MPETEPKAEPTIGPLICGTASYVDGTFVWTDYAYDDTGASERELGGGAASIAISRLASNTGTSR